MPLTRRWFLVMCGSPFFRPFVAALAAARPRHLLGLSEVEFTEITAAILLPGFRYEIVLHRGDKLGIGWYDDRGTPRAVLFIQRAGESRVQFVP